LEWSFLRIAAWVYLNLGWLKLGTAFLCEFDLAGFGSGLFESFFKELAVLKWFWGYYGL